MKAAIAILVEFGRDSAELRHDTKPTPYPNYSPLRSRHPFHLHSFFHNPIHALWLDSASTRTDHRPLGTMATVSPFRYIQLCRYLFQRLLADQPTIGKGKAKALPSALRRTPEVNSVAYATEATESRRSETSSIAGSSTSSLPPNYHPTSRPLGPDPGLPPEPSEIYRLMNDERLLVKGGVKPPKDVVVLCHGEWNVRCQMVH